MVGDQPDATRPLDFRARQVRLIPAPTGVYALCDLDGVPIYVGQSTEGIRARVRRHLTSARSDVIANRQIDVWEVGFVWAWPIEERERIGMLESHLFHRFNDESPLMNGSIPERLDVLPFPEPERDEVQVIDEAELIRRRDPSYRLPRQAEHFTQLVDHILNVKDSGELRRALEAHYARLSSYYNDFLKAQE